MRRALAPLALLAAACAGPADGRPGAPPVAVRPAPEWDALFERDEGWLGADGIFSVALDGEDALASADADTRTLLWFGDTMVGRVAPDGAYAPGTEMVRNSAAVLAGARPRPEALRFVLRRSEQGEPRTLARPATPASTGDDWLWFGDGFADGDEVVVLAFRMAPRGVEGVWNFRQRGHVLLRWRVTADGALEEVGQVDLPLDSPGDGERSDLSLGAGVLADDAGGVLHVYGTWNRGADKELVVARVPRARVADPDAWRFWDGARWSRHVDDLAPVCGGVSSELSVTPLPDGRFVLVALAGGIGEWVSVRLGANPVGPFGPAHRVWRCPEVARGEHVFAYNAKAHPHLSAPGELLVSYNVNSTDFWGETLRDASIYRPRFVRVPLELLASFE